MSPDPERVLSICIPTFNRAPFLRGAIQSIFRGLPADLEQQVEVVVSDNCSTDDTPRIINELVARHPNLRAVRNPTNLGFDGNYRASVLAARGRFSMPLGDDDWFEDGGVARILGVLRANPSLAGITVLANGYSADGQLLSSATSPGTLTVVRGPREVFAFRQLGFLFGNMSLHVVSTALAQRLLDRESLLNNSCACHQLCSMIVRETSEWALFEEACVAWRYGNDSFSANGLHRRLKLALDGYRANLVATFGEGSPIVNDFMGREAVHIAKRYVVRSKNVPELNRHYGSYVAAREERLKIYREVLGQLHRQPSFWTDVFPILATPSRVLRAGVGSLAWARTLARRRSG